MFKNVVIVNDFGYYSGGSSVVAIDTANLLNELNYNVYFFAGIGKENSFDLNDGIRSVHCENKMLVNGKNIFKALFNRKSYKHFLSFLSKLSPNDTVIHFHTITSVLTYSVLKAAKKRGFVCYFTVHDFFLSCPNGAKFDYPKNKICDCKMNSLKCFFKNCDSRNYFYKMFRNLQNFYNKKILRIYKKIDYLIYVSELCKSIVENNKIKLIDNIVIENPLNFNQHNYEKTNEDYYLCVGRIHKLKGIDILCEKFSINNKKLVIIGDGPEYQQIKEKYAKFENIIFKGWINKENLYDYLIRAKALIVSSLCNETGPLTVFEAMSVGLIPIVSEFCAATDFLRTNKVGYIYNPYNDSLNNIIDELNDVEKVEQLSKKVYDVFWEKGMTRDRYIKKIIDYYNRFEEKL